MATDTPSGNNPSSPGGDNKGSSKNRRRPLRSKRRGRKPEEGSEPREPRSEARAESRSESRSEPKSEGRGPRVQHSAAKPIEKNVRENRERRRRRRMRSKQRGPSEGAPPVVEDAFKDLPPLVPAFVYTHVLRPASRDSFEFRTEHFSKVTRKMEDFHIDLSPLYPDGSDEIKGVGYMPPAADRDRLSDEFDDEDDESYDDPEWDAGESPDAARLEGAIADEFNDGFDDTAPGDEDA